MKLTKQGIVEKTPDHYILRVIREDKGIVYGAQSIKKQTGMWGRNTLDYDVFFKKPRMSAFKTESLLDKAFGNLYYVVLLKHKDKKGKSWRVKYIGRDMIPRTKDDVVIADYTKTPNPIPQYIIIQGIRYRILSIELRKKLETLKDKEKKFRWSKDESDIRRIQMLRKIKQWRLI